MQFPFANILCVFVFDAEWHMIYMDKISAAEQELEELTCRMSSENNSHQIKKARATRKRYLESDDGDDDSSRVDGKKINNTKT